VPRERSCVSSLARQLSAAKVILRVQVHIYVSTAVTREDKLGLGTRNESQIATRARGRGRGREKAKWSVHLERAGWIGSPAPAPT
jgi:hypothetical protein